MMATEIQSLRTTVTCVCLEAGALLAALTRSNKAAEHTPFSDTDPMEKQVSAFVQDLDQAAKAIAECHALVRRLDVAVNGSPELCTKGTK